MRRVSTDQRRSRLAVRHHLASAAAASPVDVARALVALHATDPASVFLAIRAWGRALTPEAIETALCTDRCLPRMLGMRRTMFVVPVEVAPVVQADCTEAIAVAQRRRNTRLVAAAGIGDGIWSTEPE